MAISQPLAIGQPTYGHKSTSGHRLTHGSLGIKRDLLARTRTDQGGVGVGLKRTRDEFIKVNHLSCESSSLLLQAET
ncbi:hypothetical protein EYF80_056192 [Liparis tanakae]|uniref:Uncharacterized protein n=1 Tax=Liparis tanakae TaxID=230148 RepID=A0A4Z2EZ48_9TELE|nr:hypothetical protein EYF80_056192 [Liparis tanakae]